VILKAMGSMTSSDKPTMRIEDLAVLVHLCLCLHRGITMRLYCLAVLVALPWRGQSFSGLSKTTDGRSVPIFAVQRDDVEQVASSKLLVSRKEMLSAVGALLTGSLLSRVAPASAEEPTLACRKPAGNSPSNCVSTASVRQVDLYMPPWTYPQNMPADEVLARLKGAASTDVHLQVAEQKENYLKINAIRNFAIDEIEFVVNTADHVITLRSQQVEGPDVNDFGANRSRLEDIRRRAKVFGVMGEEFESADSAPREGALGQLKAFYGLKSGTGYESVNLDE